VTHSNWKRHSLLIPNLDEIRVPHYGDGSFSPLIAICQIRNAGKSRCGSGSKTALPVGQVHYLRLKTTGVPRWFKQSLNALPVFFSLGKPCAIRSALHPKLKLDISQMT